MGETMTDGWSVRRADVSPEELEGWPVWADELEVTPAWGESWNGLEPTVRQPNNRRLPHGADMWRVVAEQDWGGEPFVTVCTTGEGRDSVREWFTFTPASFAEFVTAVAGVAAGLRVHGLIREAVAS